MRWIGRPDDFVLGIMAGLVLAGVALVVAVSFGWVCWCLRPMAF